MGSLLKNIHYKMMKNTNRLRRKQTFQDFLADYYSKYKFGRKHHSGPQQKLFALTLQCKIIHIEIL